MRVWGKLTQFTGVEEPRSARPPAVLALQFDQNPSRSRAGIRIALSRRAPVSLRVCDISGRIVRRLLDATVEPGSRNVAWDGCDGQGRAMPGGVYFCTLEAAGQRLTRKLVLLR